MVNVEIGFDNYLLLKLFKASYPCPIFEGRNSEICYYVVPEKVHPPGFTPPVPQKLAQGVVPLHKVNTNKVGKIPVSNFYF